MRIVLNFTAAALGLTMASEAAAQNPRQLLKLVDYVGSDYAGAVAGGEIRSPAEYEEMRQLRQMASSQLEELLRDASDPQAADLRSGLARLGDLIESKSPPEAVAAEARKLRGIILDRFRIPVAPSVPPNPDRGRSLYASNCAICHGVKGDGKGGAASGLSPLPTDFLDPASAALLEPLRAYNATTLGIENTAMPAFSALDDTERWDIAFFLSGFQGPPSPPPPADPFALADGQLQAAEDSYREGRLAEAKDALFAAYFDGVEPVEPRLRNLDGRLVDGIERRFQELRARFLERAPAERVATEVQGLRAELRLARARLEEGPRGGMETFWVSLLIILREGIEAALVVAAILALLRAGGHTEASRRVHAGWTAALAAGILTWAGSQTLIRVSGAARELVEGAASLLAAAVLFYVSFWLLSKADLRRWMGFIQSQVNRSLARGSLWTLFAVTFLAVYRESFETVLFYQGLVQSAPGAGLPISLGFLAGALLLAGAVLGMFRLGLRIPLRQFFLVSGGLLYALAFVLAGKGIWALQEGGYAPSTPVSLPQIPLLGIFPSLEGALVQGFFLAAAAGGGLRLLLRKRPSPTAP